MQLSQRLRHGGAIAPEHHDVTGQELRPAQPVGDAPASAAYRQQIDCVAIKQFELTYRAADQLATSV